MRKFARRTIVIVVLFAGASAQSRALELVPLATYGSPVRVARYSAAARVIRLAKLGNVRAQAQLGWMYARGLGVPQNYVEAAKWYYRAADQGDGQAQLELGLMYNKGQGVPHDLVQAEMWLNLSASHAVGANRDYAARLRDAVASQMTVQQLMAAQHLAVSWYRAQ